MSMNLSNHMNAPMELAMLKGGDGLQIGRRDGQSLAGDPRLQNYNDINALQSLKYKSGDDKADAIEQTAKHFESLFVSMMIKSMRDANKVFSEGNMLQSSQSDFYQQMFDSQLAVSLSTGKGIGLAEVIKRQLTREQNLDASGRSGAGYQLVADSKFYSLEDYERQHHASPEKIKELNKLVDDIEQTVASKELDAKPVEKASFDFSSPESFIESLYPHAKQIEQETGIDARLLLAQSALETGWGKHQIYKQDGSPSFNLFGIKSHRDWEGDEASILTTEYRNGLAMKEQANFRAYDSYQDSFRDYAAFLRSNSRYDTALANAGDPKVFAKELQSAGYATDPDYADKISRILDRYMDLENIPEVDSKTPHDDLAPARSGSDFSVDADQIREGSYLQSRADISSIELQGHDRQTVNEQVGG